jgi:hypothetical protein
MVPWILDHRLEPLTAKLSAVESRRGGMSSVCICPMVWLMVSSRHFRQRSFADAGPIEAHGDSKTKRKQKPKHDD